MSDDVQSEMTDVMRRASRFVDFAPMVMTVQHDDVSGYALTLLYRQRDGAHYLLAESKRRAPTMPPPPTTYRTLSTALRELAEALDTMEARVRDKVVRDER